MWVSLKSRPYRGDKQSEDFFFFFFQNKTSHCSPNWQWHQFHFWPFLRSHKLVIGAASSGVTNCFSRSAFAINTFYKVESGQHSFAWTVFIPLTLCASKTSQSRLSVWQFLCLCSPWWPKSVTTSLEQWKKHFSGYSDCPQQSHVITAFAADWKVISTKRTQRKTSQF